MGSMLYSNQFIEYITVEKKSDVRQNTVINHKAKQKDKLCFQENLKLSAFFLVNYDPILKR